jgi:RNA:NAD 2'-phosphotransferase (TPT1/KptA family)
MRRQYVHLSVDEKTTLQIAKRKEGPSVIVTISATKAYLAGIKFYQGNKTTCVGEANSANGHKGGSVIRHQYN